MMQNVLQLSFKCRPEYNYAVSCRLLEQNTQCISDKTLCLKEHGFTICYTPKSSLNFLLAFDFDQINTRNLACFPFVDTQIDGCLWKSFQKRMLRICEK